REQKEKEASLLRQHNVAMQRRHDENMADIKKSNAERDALNKEHQKREEEIRRKNDEKSDVGAILRLRYLLPSPHARLLSRRVDGAEKNGEQNI
ncbi:hypothetical protein PENTCL1PPCAC_12625, partial [Pristionchus entomophagus]